jgi:hypothetical protein
MNWDTPASGKVVVIVKAVVQLPDRYTYPTTSVVLITSLTLYQVFAEGAVIVETEVVLEPAVLRVNPTHLAAEVPLSHLIPMRADAFEAFSVVLAPTSAKKV